jgi:hypothetical protein
MYFNNSQISIASKAFVHAEKMAARYYRLSEVDLRNLRYDIKTLAQLEEHEVSESAFAHLCRYRFQNNKRSGTLGDFYFYRICLQDNRIIDAVNRTGSFIRLSSLMLYIATHELVHVIRFDAGEGRFDATPEEKDQEEQHVHAITRQMLSPIIYPDMKIVLECFNDRHRIDNFLN